MVYVIKLTKERRLLPASGGDEARGDQPHADDKVPAAQVLHERNVAARQVIDDDPDEPENEQRDHGGGDPLTGDAGAAALTPGRRGEVCLSADAGSGHGSVLSIRQPGARFDGPTWEIA
jgi:hypothetical protein